MGENYELRMAWKGLPIPVIRNFSFVIYFALFIYLCGCRLRVISFWLLLFCMF